MGISSNGLLAFGIDFGEELPEPFEGYDEFDLDEIIAYEGGLPIYLESMTDEEAKAYFARKQEIVEASPVEHVMHCSYEYPGHIFAVRGFSYSASWGYPEKIDLEKLKVPDPAIEAFKKWLTDHGVEVDPSEEPAWHLASLYG